MATAIRTGFTRFRGTEPGSGTVLGPDEAPAADGHTDDRGSDPAPAIRHIDCPPPEPVDLVGVAGSSVARRLAPLLIVAGIAVVIGLATRSRRRRRSAP